MVEHYIIYFGEVSGLSLTFFTTALASARF